MTGDVYKNRALNTKILLEINNTSALSFCLEHSIPYVTLRPKLSSKHAKGKISDVLANDIERGFAIEKFSLDKDPAELKGRLDQFRLALRDEVNIMMGGIEFSNRYWNIRRFIEKEQISMSELSKKTGIHQVYCSHLFSKRPGTPTSYDVARVVERAYSLPNLVFEARAKESPADKKVLFEVSDETIDCLGVGAFLNRFIHIKDFMLRFGKNRKDLNNVFGFNYSSDDSYFADPPVKFISYDSARSFEKHFGFEYGSIDAPLDGYVHKGTYSLFTVSLAAYNVIGEGECLYRYVNLRRFMIDRGLNLTDLAKLIGKTRALTHAYLSDKPVSRIGGKSAWNMEEALGLKPMSLDQSVTFKIEGYEIPVKNRLRGSA